MAERNGRDLEGGNPDSQVTDRIEHWVQAIDRWVQQIDQGMGGMAEGVDPAVEPDSAPEAG